MACCLGVKRSTVTYPIPLRPAGIRGMGHSQASNLTEKNAPNPNSTKQAPDLRRLFTGSTKLFSAFFPNTSAVLSSAESFLPI